VLRISLGAIVMTPQDPAIFGMPITMRVRLAGFVTLVFCKILFAGFKTGPGLTGFVAASNTGGAWSVLGDRK
jgi:hypothetical protein